MLNFLGIPTHCPAPPIEGPAIYLTADMGKVARGKMELGKAPGLSRLCAEMLDPLEEMADEYLEKLYNKIVHTGEVPCEWHESIIVNCFKGKGDALIHGNCRGLKLLDQGIKMFERVLERIIREKVNVAEMQYGFMPG